jgi:hypothetical protein
MQECVERLWHLATRQPHGVQDREAAGLVVTAVCAVVEGGVDGAECGQGSFEGRGIAERLGDQGIVRSGRKCAGGCRWLVRALCFGVTEHGGI